LNRATPSTIMPAGPHAGNPSARSSAEYWVLVGCATSSLMPVRATQISTNALLTVGLAGSMAVVLLYRGSAATSRSTRLVLVLAVWMSLCGLAEGIVGIGGVQGLLVIIIFWLCLRVSEIDTLRDSGKMYEATRLGARDGFAIIAFATCVFLATGFSPLGGRVLALTLLPYTIWLATSVVRRERRVASVGVLLILLTLSRTAFVVALVAASIVVVWRKRSGRVRRLLLMTVAGMMFVTAVTRWSPLQKRFFTGDTSLRIGGVAINASGRLNVWQQLIRDSWRSPIFGYGPGSSRPASRAINPALDHPHNEYIRLLYEGGIPGVVIWLAFVLLLGWTLRQILRSGGSNRMRAVGGVALITAISLSMVTDNTLVYVTVLGPAGILIGCTLAAQNPAMSLTGRE
jgi:O-Antigen ligase